MNNEEVAKTLGNSKIKFGLEAQGHIPIIEQMLKENEGSSYYLWQKIGKTIGWEPLTAASYYLNYLNKKHNLGLDK